MWLVNVSYLLFGQLELGPTLVLLLADCHHRTQEDRGLLAEYMLTLGYRSRNCCGNAVLNADPGTNSSVLNSTAGDSCTASQT